MSQDDPNTDWDERARGLGGTLHIPVSSGAEENVMCHDDDRIGFTDKEVSVAEINGPQSTSLRAKWSMKCF